MGLLLLIPGLVLLLAGPWFEDQATVGTVLTVIGGIILALQVIWTAIVAGIARREFKKF